MKTVISDFKKEIDFLLAQKENVICNDDDDNDDIVHIRKKILILEMTPKENLTI